MVKIATQCINFFLCINVAKFAIYLWRFAPHCVVKFKIVYSTNCKTIVILSMSLITTRIVKTSVAQISRVPVENQITTLSVVKIAIKFSPCSALQCRKVQSSIEKFHWSKKLRKTENFSFNLNIRVPLESVNLFLHVFLCLVVILTMEHYIKLLTIEPPDHKRALTRENR